MKAPTRLPGLKRSLVAVAIIGAAVAATGLRSVDAASPTISVFGGGFTGNLWVDGYYFTPGGTVSVFYFRDDNRFPIVHNVTASACSLTQFNCTSGYITDTLWPYVTCDQHYYTVYAYDATTKVKSNAVSHVGPGCYNPG